MISVVRNHDQGVVFEIDAIKARTNVIQDLSEPRDVRHRITVWAYEGLYRDRSGYYKT